jgi:hypothetical protein
MHTWQLHGLLLRGKNTLNRSLSFHEKRWMREHARQTAMAQGSEDGVAVEVALIGIEGFVL